jgi:hypothetical protein
MTEATSEAQIIKDLMILFELNPRPSLYEIEDQLVQRDRKEQ